MLELQRITTEYVDTEDRLRLAGETQDGVRLVLWLTQRLLLRLVPHVLHWLEQQVASDSPAYFPPEQAEVVNSFAQQVAQAISPALPAVQITQITEDWLVHSIDLTSAAEILILRFKGAAPEAQAQFSVTAQLLRQWLNVLHGQCAKGEWLMTVWPTWLEATAPCGAAVLPVTMH